MTLLSVGSSRGSAPKTAGRLLHALPVTALVIDLIVMIAVGLVAILGRRELDFFTASFDVEQSVTVAGPLIILGWLATIAISGGYETDIFGAGINNS